jgi:membrane fusion protein, multidrug efflux system
MAHPTTSIRARRAAIPALVAVLVVSSCGKSAPPAPAPPPPKVKVVHPVAREVTEWDEYTARLDAVESVEVRPRVSGYLQSIHFQDGDQLVAVVTLYRVLGGGWNLDVPDWNVAPHAPG